MPFATTNDGVRLHYEETGAGSAIVFVHEFAGDHRILQSYLIGSCTVTSLVPSGKVAST